MKIKFLGSGGAFTLGSENYQSNILITDDEGKHFLYDCGTTIPEALAEENMIPQDIETIYISHLHADHSGGIEYMAFKTYFECFNFGKSGFGQMKPNLLAYKSILENGWNNSWKGGLRSIQGQTNSLETYFETTYMNDNDCAYHGNIKIQPIQTVHVVDDRMIQPSYGIMVQQRTHTTEGTDYGKKVFISGDSQFAPNQMLTYFQQADIIFHDCEFAEYPNSVHAQFHQLCTLNEQTKAKMYLYHYSLGDRTFNELQNLVEDNGFAGIISRGQEFNL